MDMILINNIYIQKEIFTLKFKCDLNKCNGACCTSGPGQTPLSNMEIILLNDYQLKKDNDQCFIDSNGQDSFLKLNESGDCIFSDVINDIAFCSLHPENKLLKPAYCRLFPLKIKRKNHFQFITIEKREICDSAFTEQKLYIWEFLSEYLIFQFGKKWYNDFVSVFHSQFAEYSGGIS
ncbi:DUF3109 family protein [bacterium]|nr:DUF3109 family protein [bacterium]